MTFHWGPRIPGWILFSFLVLVLLCVYFFPPRTKPFTTFRSKSVTGDPYHSPLNDSLPYYSYKQIEDSLARQKRAEDYFSTYKGGSGFQFGYLGIFNLELQNSNDYFLTLDGYSLSEFTTIENKKTGTLITYPVWDEVTKIYRNGHLEKKVISLKYEADEKTQTGKVYIPIHSNWHSFLLILFFILGVAAAIAFLGVVIYIPIRFLYQLAKGKAFTEENIGSLYLTGWSLIVFFLLVSLVPMIGHFFLQGHIPPEIHFSYYAAFFRHWEILVTGLGVLLLAKAFLQGLNLKEEQDLTV